MKRFMVLYKGPATPPDASHEGWPEWFGSLGEALVDKGNPMLEGWSLSADDMAEATAPRLNGYSIIQAADADAARALLATHPYLALGTGRTVELYEIPAA